SLMAVAFFSGRLFQNYVLLRYEEGVRELAMFALAMAFFHPFRGTLIFAPQMANVLVRGPKSFRASFSFLIGMSVLFTVPILLVAWTPLGRRIMPLIYGVSDENIRLILLYLRYFTPLVLVGGVCFYCEGLLVQAKRTGIVSALRIGSLGMLVAVLVIGCGLRWRPVTAVGLSVLLSAVTHAIVAGGFTLAFRVRHSGGEDSALKQREIAAFFLPMVATTVMFALTWPIIFAFLTSLNPDGDPGLPAVEPMIAGVSLALSFSLLFHATLNQLRHLLVTFVREDRRGVRRFVMRVTAGVAVLMVIVVVSPAARLFLRHLQGAEGPTLTMARQALWVMLLVPPIVGCRNYFHGLAMVDRRTGAMAAGSFARNLAVIVCAPALVALGWYNHVAAAIMFVSALAAEAATVFLLTRARRRKSADQDVK
ncbi:MAG: hypothetical protein KAX44_04795, partial [Candidatus Brocadiae bacterium]|nr:hypothetical protein [Candidatus Brocadiia bacterium]